MNWLVDGRANILEDRAKREEAFEQQAKELDEQPKVSVLIA